MGQGTWVQTNWMDVSDLSSRWTKVDDGLGIHHLLVPIPVIYRISFNGIRGGYTTGLIYDL